MWRDARLLTNTALVPTEQETKIANWIFRIQDRPKWREFVEKTKTFNK